MIEKVTLHRFKQFSKKSIDLDPTRVTLVAGGNNAGKSSLLHGLAVWEFCRTAIEMERGPDAFLAGAKRLGLGLGDDEFSPINVPSLKHLWTNLKTQRRDEPDGYTLKIGCEWRADGAPKKLEFGLALANDRLFIKTTQSNLNDGDAIPRMAYLPPFAGIAARETRQTGAIRRRRIGEGLAGAVLRNLLLDMYEFNQRERVRLRGDRSKISDPDLKRLRETDPWEQLQATLRDTFSSELAIDAFSEEYHSYIRVEVVKGKVSGHKLKRHPNYTSRDLMVEGSGFLQWLSVYTLALDPSIDVLLLDEPDAHLHASLQDQMLEHLRNLAARSNKQVLVATHSTELLRHAAPSTILQVLPGGKGGKYLREEHQKVGLLAGLGSEYAPRVDRVKRTCRVLFIEGSSDINVLKVLAAKLGVPWPEEWVEWRSPTGHKERKQLFLALREEIPGLVALSLRDRDDEAIGTVGPKLEDKAIDPLANFHPRKWRRRHIESYLLWPPAIAGATGLDEETVRRRLADEHGLAIGAKFTAADAPPALLDANGKSVLKEGPEAILGQFDATPVDVARAMEPVAVPEDVRTFLAEVVALASSVPKEVAA